MPWRQARPPDPPAWAARLPRVPSHRERAPPHLHPASTGSPQSPAARPQGNVIVVGRKSQYSLYDSKISSFEDDQGAYDQKDAAGFIKLQVGACATCAAGCLRAAAGWVGGVRALAWLPAAAGVAWPDAPRRPRPPACLQALRLRTLARNRGEAWSKNLF